MQQNIFRSAVLFLVLLVLASMSSAQMRSHKLGIGASGSGYFLITDDNNVTPAFSGGGGINLSYSVIEHLGIRLMFGVGQLAFTAPDKATWTTSLLSGNAYVSYDIIPHGQFNPFVFGGIGGIYFDPHPDLGGYPSFPTGVDKIDMNYLVGAGVDYFLSEFMSVTLSGEYAITNNDWLDLTKTNGTANDSYARVNLEFRYYFFDQDYVTTLIKALQDRMQKK